MKYKRVAILLSIAIGTAGLTGCGESSSETQGQLIYGEITEVSEDAVTIELGTQKEDEDGQEESGQEESGQEQSGQAQGPGAVTLDLTGETKEIEITDDTQITRGGMGGAAPDGEAPEKPEGETSDGEAPEGEVPEKPEGETSDGEAPEGQAPGGEQQTMEVSELKEGDTVSIALDNKGAAETITVMSMDMGGGMGGQSQGVESYDAVQEYTEDTEAEGETLSSTGTDENVIHAYEGAEVTLKDFVVTRESTDSEGGDTSSFYGVGAAILDTEGTAYVSGGTIDTDASGAAGIFAYGEGVVYAADTVITTNADTSGGIHAAGGGTLYAWDITAETDGESAAAIRSDRGGGTMVVNGGSYTSNGTGSPAVYSTADIAVNDASLTANGSEAVCIEGLNSLRLFNCSLTGNMSDIEQNDCTWNVILYQSMSGDSEVGNSVFDMEGGTLTAENGGMFYTTNTESTFVLSDVDITYAEDSEFFLRCTGNANGRGWGTAGANGADCHFTAVAQEMEGDIIWDSISKLDFYMTDQSRLTGAVKEDDTYAEDGSGGYANLYLEAGSTWVVTGDSTLSALDSAGTIVDEEGNTVTIQGTDGTVYVKGSGEYTVTVASYSDEGDVSDASEQSAWSEYEVEKPSALE